MDFDEAQAIASKYAPSDYYDREYKGMEQMYMPALLTLIEEYPVGRVLEVGPGWGTTAVWLDARGFDVSVMDLVPVGEFMSQEIIDEYDINYIHHDLEDSALPDGMEIDKFDLIIMTQVIHHLSWRPDRALRHVAELMNPGATYLTSVLDRKSYRRLDSAFGYDWRNVPEWKTTERSPDTIKCMYNDKMLRSLLDNQFSHVDIWKPKRSTVLFAKASR